MAIQEDDTIVGQPAIDFEALGVKPVSDEDLYGLASMQEEGQPAQETEIDFEALGVKPVSDLELYGFETQPVVEEPRDNSWDTLRGLEVSMRQVPQLAYGVAGLVGETAEQLTGYGESLRDFGFKGYQDWAESMEPISKETDDVTVAWQRAKEGDVGALVDWAQYGIGYALGQLGESAAVAVLGGIAGGAAGAAGGPTAIPAAAGGAVVAAAGKQGFKALAQNLVEKAIANQATKIVTKQAQKEGVELTAEQLAKRASQEAIKREAGKQIGSNAAIFANAIGMQLGAIYGSAEEKAREEGRELTGVDLARIWGTGIATGGLEGVVDKFGLDLLKGKFAEALPAGRLAGAAVAAPIGLAGEAATEAVQTVGERFGAGRELLSDEAINEYINASALGGLGGGAIGGVGGFISGNPKENAAAKAKVSSETNKDIAPATAETVARQADAVIAETVQETPEQKVARLQEEATAAAGIELEEEAPVSGLPPERIKSARWFESASRNRLKELQDKDEAGVEDFTTQETEEYAFLQSNPTPEQIAERYGYQVRTDVEPTTVTPKEPAAAPTPAESLLTRKSELDAEAKRLGADNISSFNSMYATRESLTEEQRNLLNQYGEYNKQVVELGWRDAAKLDDADFGRWEKIKLTTKPVSDQELTDLGKLYLAFNERGETQKAESVLKSIQSGKRKTNNTIEGWFKATDETLNQEEIDTINRENQDWNDSVDAMTEILGRKTPPEEISPADIAPTLTPTPVTPVAPTPEGVSPTPETPNLEPLRRVARAEQTEEDVSGLVGQGLVELYNGQPVITQAGLETLPEAERPRLNPEARKIQIDTGANEVVAEAISKNLRIGVDQVGTGVRMPAGWTLDGDIYVPPTPQEVAKAEEPVAPAPTSTRITQLENKYDEARAKLDALGPEPRKPSPESRFFGAGGRSAADPTVVAKYDTDVKAYNSYRRKYSAAKKSEVEASNQLFRAKQEVSPAPEVRESRRELRELFRAGQPIDDYEGRAPDVNWNAVDMYGEVWSEKTVESFVESPHKFIYTAMLDSGDLSPKVVEMETANEIERMNEEQIRSKYPDEFVDEDVSWREVRSRMAEESRNSWESSKQDMARPLGRGYPPAVVRRTGENTFEVIDGNHRIDLWQEQGFTAIPVWVVDDHLWRQDKKRKTPLDTSAYNSDERNRIRSFLENLSQRQSNIGVDPEQFLNSYRQLPEEFKRAIEYTGRAKLYRGTENEREGKTEFPEAMTFTTNEGYAKFMGTFQITNTGLPQTGTIDSKKVVQMLGRRANKQFEKDLRDSGFEVGDDEGEVIILNDKQERIRQALRGIRTAGMEPEAVTTKLESLGFGRGGIVSVVNEPDASFEGRTIIRDGKVVGIELNAAALKDDAAIERVLNHEIAESANADGALNNLVAGLTPKERKEINDAITRLGYAEKARTAEEAARAVELLAEGWRGRRWFDRAVARVEAWANKLGYKLTRRAAEYIAARNVSEINAEFKQAYNKFINVQGEAREGRAFVTPAENARFLELAKDPEANREELQKMVDAAAQAAGYTREAWQGAAADLGPVYKLGLRNPNIQRREQELNNFGFFFTFDKDTASKYVKEGGELRRLRVKGNLLDLTSVGAFDQNAAAEEMERLGISIIGITRATKKQVWSLFKDYGEVLRKRLQDAGYDGVLFNEEYRDGSVHVTGAVFESNQLKLADPVTRDNQGNVIPLSERFQTATPDIRYSLSETRESRREDAIPTFSEGSPEASTLSTMAASMAKVDTASEGKPNPENKPTYKISEIASVWMDQGGDARQLQDMVVEYTNLTPANAKKVANAIAKQYDIQQSIATAFLETQTGLSVEALPEGVTLPKEVDPDRPRPVMQRLFDVFMGVRVPPVKIEVNEKTALKQQIRLKAAANRAAKQEQQRTAEEVVEIIKAMELLGPVRPKQVQALAKRAARVIWTSEKSVEAFSEYAAKVVENANYDADLREAKDAQKRAKQLSTQKKVAMSPQREVLEDVSKIPVNKLDDPRMFAEAVNYYLRGFKSVLSPDYVVIPDAEMESYLSGAQSETQRNQRDLDREANERLAKKYGIEPDQVNEMMESIDIIKQIEAQENREALENLLTEKAIETQQGLRGYDTDNLRADQRSIVSFMLKVDPKALDPEERQRFIRITNNIIYNNQTNGAEYFVAVAKGQQSAREAAQDSTMVARNRAWINLLPRFISERMQRGWALELQSIADTFRNAFGKGAMAKMYDAMGMLDLNLGFTKANNTIDEIQEKIAEFHRNLEKKYKAAARNQDGLLAEGVVGFLIQSVPKKDELTSINQRRDLIRQDIANRRRSTTEPDKVAMADRIETILNQIDGDSVEAILDNMKREFPANHESLIWYKDTLLPQYKDFLKSFDENFNDQANNYENPNYLTIGFTSAGPSLAITPEEQSLFYDQVSLRPKQSAYTIKRVDYTEIPKDRTTKRPKEIEFNLRRNVFNGLSDQINKAYTSSGWQRIASFMKTPEAEVVFGGAANKDFFIERLNRLRLSRMRRGSMGSGGAIEKAVDSLSVISRKLGTGIALGGIYQWIKQPPDQLVTAWGSGGRGDLLAKNIAPKTQKLARTLLNKFSIGRRGDASAGYKYINQMEGHQNRLERYFSESKWDQAKEQAGKIADVWMIALKSSDFLAASAAWMTYYEGELNKQDIKIDDWSKEADLIESDPKRRQAAAFAEQMTDIYQGSSDPTSMATFAQSGKTGWENLVKAIFVPFNSFAIQQRMRLYSDARDAISGSKSGVGGLSGTIGGLILFHATKRYAIPAISGLGVSILYGLMGVDMDEPDEEKQKEEANKNWRQFLADITGNLLVGGTPQLVESQFIDAMNRASYLVSIQLENDSILNDDGEIMSYDQYSKERSPFYRYKSFDNAMSLGMFDIGIGQAEQVALQTKMLATPEEMEMYTPEEQRLLYFSALSEWLYMMRLNDADFARLVGKARRDMIKAAKDREKELQRIRSGR